MVAKWMGLEVPIWLMFAIGLGVVLLVSLQTPLSSSSGSSSRRGNGKSKEGTEKEAPASDAAKDVARRLGVSVGGGVATASGRARRRVPVTVCVNDVVLRRSMDGEWVAIESAVKVLALLNEVASVFLVAWVESDLDESLVRDVAISSGLISSLSQPSTSPPTPPAKPDNSTTPSASAPLAASLAGTGIAEHRLLFCSSHIGQVAVVQQLAPSLHIGGPIALLEGICRFVPSLVRIDPTAVALPPASQASEEKHASSSRNNSSRDGGYKLEWREFTSLAAAAGLPSVTTAEVGGKSKDNGESGESTDNGSPEGASTSSGAVAVDASTSTSKPGAEVLETRPSRPLGGDGDAGTIAGSSSGKFSDSGGAETESEGETAAESTVDFSAIGQANMSGYRDEQGGQ